jgi:DNA replication initiation complex subunit (GINS family)
MPPGEEMGFELIRQVQLKESRGQMLTKIPADFFEQLSAHIERLKAIAREETARDAMSARATLAQNELRSTVQLAREIVTHRLRKVAYRAVDALEGGRVDLQNLTPAEHALYGDIAQFMSRARDSLLPSDRSLKAASATTADAAVAVHEADAAAAAALVPSLEGAGTFELPSARPQSTARAQTRAPPPAPPTVRPATPAAPPATATDDMVVHMLKDVPQFAGEGGASYALRQGDIVDLPRRLADVLVRKGVAEAVEVAPAPAAGGRAGA